MNIIVIIQARIGSSRLPGKVLKPLGKLDVLTYSVMRCRAIDGVNEVVIATTNESQDDLIVEWCQKNHVPFFRGSEEDVLERYVQCAEMYRPDYVIRVTSDCPFVDYEMASEIVQLIKKEKAEIVLLKGELPRGLAIELLAYEALVKIHALGQEARHREHVTYYAYEFPEQFHAVYYRVPSTRQYPTLRITLDTESDYELLLKVSENFGDVLVSSTQVIQFLIEHPHIASINAHIEQKPVS